jgi:hypothetical protein
MNQETESQSNPQFPDNNERIYQEIQVISHQETESLIKSNQYFPGKTIKFHNSRKFQAINERI